jgi:hypothetical protein
MLRLSGAQIERFSASTRGEEVQRVHSALAGKGTHIDVAFVTHYVEMCHSRGIYDYEDVRDTVHVVARLRILRYDLTKVELLLARTDLSVDHRIIPLCLLVHVLERQTTDE